MGSEKSKLPPAAQESRDNGLEGTVPDTDPLRREPRYQARRGNGAMRVREAAVVPFAVRADEDYPALVDGILGHVFSVLRELDEQQVDIMLLRDDTRVALARLKKAA